MLEAGRPTNGHDNRGWKPIHFAAAKGSNACMELLLEASKWAVINYLTQGFESKCAKVAWNLEISPPLITVFLCDLRRFS